MEYLQRALDADPENVEAKINLSTIYAQAGNLKRAESFLLEVLTRDEKNIPALINLGQVYFDWNKFELARKYWQDAAKLDPENPGILQKLKRLQSE